MTLRSHQNPGPVPGPVILSWEAFWLSVMHVLVTQCWGAQGWTLPEGHSLCTQPRSHPRDQF